MLIQDLKFFEEIDNLDDIQGGSSTSATSVKPGAAAAATSEGEISFIETSATGPDGISTSTVLSDTDGAEILNLGEIISATGLGDIVTLSLM